MNRRRFLTLAAAFAAAPASAITRWQGTALGADAQITLNAPPDIAETAIETARTILRDTEALFSLYRPSALTRLNATGQLTAPDRRFHTLLDHCDQIHTLTDGRFDPTVQPLWQALAAGQDPTAARATIGWHRIRRSRDAVTLAPGQQLTLNGIAQGFATDLVADAFRALGLGNTLIDIGEFRALGGPFRIAVEDPAHGAITTRQLSNRAIATSSPGALRVGGRAHILNPQGETRPRWSTVSVEADSATLADGLSTALCMADPEFIGKMRRLAGVHRITAADTGGDITTF